MIQGKYTTRLRVDRIYCCVTLGGHLRMCLMAGDIAMASEISDRILFLKGY